MSCYARISILFICIIFVKNFGVFITLISLKLLLLLIESILFDLNVEKLFIILSSSHNQTFYPMITPHQTLPMIQVTAQERIQLKITRRLKRITQPPIKLPMEG